MKIKYDNKYTPRETFVAIVKWWWSISISKGTSQTSWKAVFIISLVSAADIWDIPRRDGMFWLLSLTDESEDYFQKPFSLDNLWPLDVEHHQQLPCTTDHHPLSFFRIHYFRSIYFCCVFETSTGFGQSSPNSLCKFFESLLRIFKTKILANEFWFA